MNIGIIGAGRVATHLAKQFAAQQHLSKMMSRSHHSAEQLAAQTGAQAVIDVSDFVRGLDVIFICVSDQQIATVAAALAQQQTQALVVHTSGSTHIDVLQQNGLRCGVFYPLQTFSLERDVDWSSTPLLIEAQDPADQASLMTLAQSLSQRVYAYDSAQRLSLHLAAVFACNFANYCYDMSKQVLDAAQVDFSLLYPLMLETTQKATQHEPRQVQTGPAMRGDVNILDRHQDMLAHAQRPDLAAVYHLLSQQILQRHQA